MRRLHSKALLYSGVNLDDLTILEENVVLFYGVNISESTVGRSTYIQAGTYCHNVKIGPFCSIASRVVIGLANHPIDYISTSPVFYDNSQPLPHFLTNRVMRNVQLPCTEIGADVWIGDGAKIMSGVTIGVGAVIAAGAVVTKDVLPYAVVGGVPAKLIRKRFDEHLIASLLSSRWWDMSDIELKKYEPLFANPQDFLNALGSL